MNILPGESKLGAVSRRIRLRGSRSHGHAWRLKVPSPSLLADTAWIRTSLGVTQWARQSYNHKISRQRLKERNVLL